MARRIVLLNGIPAGSTIALIRSPSSAPLHDGMSLMLRVKKEKKEKKKGTRDRVPMVWRWWLPAESWRLHVSRHTCAYSRASRLSFLPPLILPSRLERTNKKNFFLSPDRPVSPNNNQREIFQRPSMLSVILRRYNIVSMIFLPQKKRKLKSSEYSTIGILSSFGEKGSRNVFTCPGIALARLAFFRLLDLLL